MDEKHFQLYTVTFQHRHENKTFSACTKDHSRDTRDHENHVNHVNHENHVNHGIWHDKQSLLSLHMITKVVQPVPRMNKQKNKYIDLKSEHKTS